LEETKDKESGKEKDKVDEKAVGSTGEGEKVDKAEKEQAKTEETTTALPATTTSMLSPT